MEAVSTSGGMYRLRIVSHPTSRLQGIQGKSGGITSTHQSTRVFEQKETHFEVHSSLAA